MNGTLGPAIFDGEEPDRDEALEGIACRILRLPDDAPSRAGFEVILLSCISMSGLPDANEEKSRSCRACVPRSVT
jgi:hypothetical protein